MRATGTTEASLVVAAQAGDQRALEELVASSLPLVYNIVGRALSGHPDVDDIVQDTMLRALRELRSLRTPESFRSWLVTIAVRQVGTHRHRRTLLAQRTAGLDEAASVPDGDGDFESLTILRLGLSGQRRQVARASRWLDPDDRALLSLWWLETTDQLTRAELADALGLTVAHAGVRIQRMNQQLEACRSIVAALDARPRCADLEHVVANWNGQVSALWRKRIARHVRGCQRCHRAAEGMVPADRLLAGLALVPVPLALGAALKAKSTLSTATAGAAGTQAGLHAPWAHTVGTHPLVAWLVAGALVAGAAVVVPMVASGPEPSPAVTVPGGRPLPGRATGGPPTPAPTPTTMALGSLSLESVNEPGAFVAHVGDRTSLVPVEATSRPDDRRRATFEVVPGLADADCYSLRAGDGRYLRHSQWLLRLNVNDGSVLFRQDATFCARAGSTADSVSLESYNYRGRFLRHIGTALWVDPSDGTAAFRADSSFRTRDPLTGSR
jgi:RNA polymerase sigma factor (sigma-70 family)